MKAWAVTSLPGSGVIVFCDHVSTARKLGAGVLGYSYKSVVAKRDRVWDRYYGKRITPKDLLNHDWWISCQRCKDICIPDNPDVVISKNRVFCRPECVTESCDPFPLDKFIINNNEISEEPCPFCGSNNAGPHFQTFNPDVPARAMISCRDCYARGPYIEYQMLQPGADYLEHQRNNTLEDEDLWELWNRR